jgi:hypothetical protein
MSILSIYLRFFLSWLIIVSISNLLSVLCTHSIEYLDHVVSTGIIAPDPSKIAAIYKWHIPTIVSGLHGFLGLTGFYRRFIAGYASIALPLTELLKRDNFRWSPFAQIAFDNLKSLMASAPLLSLPNFSQPFALKTDASSIVIGAVLLQGSHPISYFSNFFCPRMSQASAYLHELHAITSAVKRWQQYLLSHFIIIQTD